MTTRSLLFCATALVAAAPTPLWAAQATIKVLAENDKMQIIEVVEKPGDTVPMELRLGNGVYMLSGGTFERTFDDGTKQTSPRKTGEATIVKETRAYAVKNVGTTTIHIIEFVQKK